MSLVEPTREQLLQFVGPIGEDNRAAINLIDVSDRLVTRIDTRCGVN